MVAANSVMIISLEYVWINQGFFISSDISCANYKNNKKQLKDKKIKTRQFSMQVVLRYVCPPY